MKKNGFTLPEVLIVLVVGIIVGGLLLSILVNNTGLFYQQSSKVSLGLGSNDALIAVRSTIKEASSIAVSYPEIPPPTFTSGNSVLVLKQLSIDANSNIIADTYDYIVFTKEGDKFRMKVFPNASSARKSQDQILAHNVENLIFNYYDKTDLPVAPQNAVKVKTTLFLKQKAGKGFETTIATSEANLRND